MEDLPHKGNLEILQDWAHDLARSMFSRLDKNLSASVFFIAIPPAIFNSDSATSAVSIEDTIYLLGDCNRELLITALEHFNHHLKLIEPAIADNERPPLSLPINWKDRPVHKGVAIGKAAVASLNEVSETSNTMFFGGKAVWREEDAHFVCPILSFNRQLYERHYRLKQSFGWSTRPLSLVDIVKDKFVASCVNAIEDKAADVGKFNQCIKPILTDSAADLVNSIWLDDQRNLNTHNFWAFQDYNAISALPYEKRESCGKIVLARNGHPDINIKVRFTEPVPVNNRKLCRKLLEISQKDNLLLLCDLNQIYGLGEVTSCYNSEKEDLFTIEFVSRNLWRLLHNRNELMVVELGQPRLPSPKLSLEDFEKAFIAQFKKGGNVDKFFQLVEEATKQSHGTLMVITEAAESEADRFKKQCVKVKAFQVAPENVIDLTSIDGAILLDPQGKCHALGVILDGEAVENEDTSRGSRYNSSLRYISTQREKGKACLAVIVSTDGMVNLI